MATSFNFTTLTDADIAAAHAADIELNSVASPAEETAVENALFGSTGVLLHGIHQKWANRAMIAFISCCYDNSTSAKADLPGSVRVWTDAGGDDAGTAGERILRFNDIASVIKQRTTLRRYAGLYSDAIRAYRQHISRPPQKWQLSGHKDANKYLAYDFVARSTNRQKSFAGLPSNVPLTDAQMEAIDTVARVSIHRARENERVTTVNEYAAGRASLGGPLTGI